MKAVITVVGKDTLGIVAKISGACFEYGANIVDITQKVMREYFTMILLVELDALCVSFSDFADKMAQVGLEMGLDVKVMHEDIFNSMHRI
jgi:ACT domain-containing protein